MSMIFRSNLSENRQDRILKNAAWIACGVNFLASLLMLLILAPGLDLDFLLADRLRYIAENRLFWTLSWLTWVGAACTLIYFLTAWGDWLKANADAEFSTLIRFGVTAGVLGLVPDTIAETFYLGVMPNLAEAFLHSGGGDTSGITSRFKEWETAATMLTGFLGNGLYCLGGIVLTHVSLQVKGIARSRFYFGAGMWLCGWALSVAAMMHHALGLKILTALTMTGFIVWSALLARKGPKEA